MSFNKLLEQAQFERYHGVVKREAVRAIIFLDGNILMVQSNTGDYKFPGGGVGQNESHMEGLIREVAEETGYLNCNVKEYAGAVVESRMDMYNRDALFEMSSYYYICELADEERAAQQLDEYESLLEYTAQWISLDEAIAQNETLLERGGQNSWLQREVFVLKELKKSAI